MKNLIFIFIFCISVEISSAQTIRKAWSELTSSEITAYVNAINTLTKSQVQNLALEHERLFFSGIHTTPQFLPWHRIFLEYFENLLKSINPTVSIPYWDCMETWTASSLLFQNSAGQSTGLFGLNVDGAIWEDPYDGNMFNRDFHENEHQPTEYLYANYTTFPEFSFNLQTLAHNPGHTFVGGDMKLNYSPIDPIFYLHHSMVDKAWADWYINHPTADISILDNNMPTFNVYFPAIVNAETLINSGDFGIWYAYHNLLRIFYHTSSNIEIYHYNTGSIESQYFTVSNTSNVLFQTDGQDITLSNEFEVKLGGIFETKTN